MDENLNNNQEVPQIIEETPVVESTTEASVTNTEQTTVDAKKEKKINWILIIGLVVIGVLVAIVFGFIALFSLITNNSSKLVCKSKEGNITIFYDKTQITGYTAVGISYELDQQKQIAYKIGTDEYMKEFTNWFETHTSGTCKIEKK